MVKITPDRYSELCSAVESMGYGHEREWANSVSPPETPESFAMEASWVICCSGFKEQAARITHEAVRKALYSGESATLVFPSSGKGRAIDRIWNEREMLFSRFTTLQAGKPTPEELIAWVGTLPYVGGRILRYHFSKNLGIDCAKPDRWLCRLAGIPENSPIDTSFSAAMSFCRPLAIASGDRVAAVDLVLWRACNLGFLNSEIAESKQDPAC